MTKEEEIKIGMARIIDHPSVYMGMPRKDSLRKSESIIDYLKEMGVLDFVQSSSRNS